MGTNKEVGAGMVKNRSIIQTPSSRLVASILNEEGSQRVSLKSNDNELSSKATDIFNDLDAIIGKDENNNLNTEPPSRSQNTLHNNNLVAEEEEQEDHHTESNNLKADAPSNLLKDISIFSGFGSIRSIQMGSSSEGHEESVSPTNRLRYSTMNFKNSSIVGEGGEESDDDDGDSNIRPATPQHLLKDISMYSVLGHSSNWSIQQSPSMMTTGNKGTTTSVDLTSMEHHGRSSSSSSSSSRKIKNVIDLPPTRQHSINWAAVGNVDQEIATDENEDEEDLKPSSPGDLSKEFSGMSIEK